MNFLEKYNIDIEDKELLLTSLTHTSYANEHNVTSYERLLKLLEEFEFNEAHMQDL